MDKPIAWYDPSNGMVSTDQDCSLFTPLGQVWPLYAKEEAKDEPVACKECHLKDTVYDLLDDLKVANLKLSVRPQRTWVGLTDDEIMEHQMMVPNSYSLDLIEFAKAIEAKLKEKNT
jgi:hypothetical protein